MFNPNDEEMIKKTGLIWLAFILALVLAFIILKIIAVITWSWWWVFAPIWIPMVSGLIMNLLGIKPPGQ